MDWIKAKKISILILVVLNVVLVALNYRKGYEYKLTAGQEKAAFSVMAQNGINIYTELISDYRPMGSISVYMPEIGSETFMKIFFKNGDEIETAIDYNKIIYKSGTKILVIEGNKVSFVDSGEDKRGILEEDARRSADSLMKSVGLRSAGGYELDSFYESEGSYVFEYYLKFKEFKIFSSRAVIQVGSSGIKNFSASFFGIDGLSDKKHEICSCDEALLTFMYEAKKQGLGSLFVTKIELGYDFQNTGEIAEGRSLNLVPFYYIYVANEEGPYVVDAYKNEIKPS